MLCRVERSPTNVCDRGLKSDKNVVGLVSKFSSFLTLNANYPPIVLAKTLKIPLIISFKILFAFKKE
jgi:hypothetical protein